MELKYFRICRVRCNSCGKVLEWQAYSKNDCSPSMIVCKCKKIGLSPAATMYRIAALTPDARWDDLSETWGNFDEHISNTETIISLEN